MSLDADRELAEVNAALAMVPMTPEHLLPVLQQVQARVGYVSQGAIRMIAHAFNLSRADVYGVVTFYGDLREAPVGDTVVQLCMAEACQAAGCRDTVVQAERALGVAMGQTTADGRVHFEATYCLGNCALGPAVRVGDRVYGGVTADRCAEVLSAALSDAQRDAVRPANGGATTAANSGPRVYVPNDTGAQSLGANAVADALAALGYTVIRNGSRGAYWMEPLVEVDSPAGRVGFANVGAADVPALFGGGTVPDASHKKSVGLVADVPWLRDQTRLTFARAGVIDPLSLEDYRAHGGLVGLTRALTLRADQIVDEITASGLRGRGGAAFPAGIKWNTVRQAEASQKYIVCNADEGDSGTYADRLLIEADPYQLIEGMIIAGLAVGATRGFIYLRSEYPHAIHVLTDALERARTAGLLGSSVLGSSHAFDIALRVGAGAYICGEETALLESLEGKRGVVRAKPPLPALAGLFGQPTVINNVLTLAAATDVLARGGVSYAMHGVERSKGTMPFQLGGNLMRGGLVELPFGLTLRELLERWGGGSWSDRPLKAVQVGGPLGAYLPPSLWDTPLGYESFAAVGAMLGHGGIVAFDDTVDMGAQAEFAMAFCAHESCGKCTPCRIGSTRGVETIQRIRRGEEPRAQWTLLEDLLETMELGSLCALGGLTPMPVRSVMQHFAGDLLASPKPREVVA